MYIILRSEETGFPITRTCPTSRQGDLLFLDAFVFIVLIFASAKTDRRPIEAIGGVSRLGSAGMYGCVCVFACDEMSDFPSASRDQCCQKLFLQSTNYMSFFLLLGYIILWGSHIKLVCDNFEFYFLRLGNLKLMLLRSFFLRQEFFCFVSMPLCLCVNPSNYFSVYRFWETKLVMFIIFV